MTTPPSRALIIVDAQNEYFTGKLKIEYPPVNVSLANITAAMDSAWKNGIPVIVVQHDGRESSPVFAKGSEGWQLHPEIEKRPATLRINKTKASVFYGTTLHQWLKNNHIDTLTIAGYMTHNCDAASVYEAAHNGFRVEFLSDATGSLPYRNAAGSASAEEIHRVYCTVLHSNFAAVTSTKDWIDAVQQGKTLDPDNIYLSLQRATEG